MKLALTLLVRDEVDIIRSNLDYHLSQGVDLVLVTDNGSRDGTLDVLTEFARRGAIDLRHEPPSDFSQHRWVTRMARDACVNYGADWVINADADEFFLDPGGTLRDAVAAVAGTVSRLLVSRHDFVPFDRPGVKPPPVEMIHRKTVSLNLAGRALPPKVIHRGAADVVVAQGNHGAESSSFTDPPIRSTIEIFHFPIRSLQQFESKVRNGGSGYARNRELEPSDGFHKRYWYDLWLKGELDREFHERRHFDGARLRSALESGELTEDRTLAVRLQ